MAVSLALVMVVWLLVLVICGAAVLLGPVWTEIITEHAMFADLLEAPLSTSEYLGRVATVVTAAAEHVSCMCLF